MVLLGGKDASVCSSFADSSCDPTVKSFTTLDGSVVSYRDCNNNGFEYQCKCVEETSPTNDCSSGTCVCYNFLVYNQPYTFNVVDPNKPYKIFCGESTHGFNTGWAGDKIEYACVIVNVSYFAVDNDESSPTQRVDTIRNESWDYFGGNADVVCNANSLTPVGPGDYGDRCWGSSWWSPSAGFCAKDYLGTYADGICLDGYCAFAIDDQINVSGGENIDIWDSNTRGYPGDINFGTLESNQTIGHFCTGYMMTGLHVATFCADRNPLGWEYTRAGTTCYNNADDDNDGWLDEYFRWTNEYTCVECNETHHVKDNTSGNTYVSSLKEPVCEVGCLADPGCDEVVPETYNSTGSYCDKYCRVSPPCPNGRVPEPGDACYLQGVYNWGLCTIEEFDGPNRCHANISDSWCEQEGYGDGSKCYCLSLANLSLDIGNDSKIPWEWENRSLDFTNVSIWELWRPPLEGEVVDKINDILTSDCGGFNCSGCVVIEEDGEQYCIIPLVFRSGPPNESINATNIIHGSLRVYDINFTFWYLNMISGVGYGRSFPLSQGGDWTFSYQGDYGLLTSPPMRIPQRWAGSDPWTYVYGSPPDDSKDTMDNAMYRLLVKVDADSDSTVNKFERIDERYDPFDTEYPFNASYMWFDAEDVVKTMNLVGPIEVKLVVWI
jgi:hypothetical protein